MNFVQPAKVQCSSFFRCQSIFGMLIPRKLHSQIESRNSWVFNRDSILPQYVPFTGVFGVGLPAGVRRGGGDCQPVPDTVPGQYRGPRWSISTVGGGTRKTSQNSQRTGRLGKCNGHWPLSDAAGQSVDVTGVWARKTVGSSRVFGAVVHMSKHRLGT